MRILPWLFDGRIRHGSLSMTGPDGRTRTFAGPEPGPGVGIRIKDPSLDRNLLLNPELRLAEAYMDGTLEITAGSLGDFLTLYWLNSREMLRNPVFAGWSRLLRATQGLLQRNSVFRARRNAAHHYDIGNDLYRLFLDDDMQYSCAYFPTGRETLEQAQLAKKRHIAAKLVLRPGQRVLDIGCGWGGMAIYLAQVADVEVLGITLAEEQLRLARERAQAAGVADRVRFELLDYRGVEGEFDRIVSVGMFEHVGRDDFGTFFAALRDRMAPDGVALLHSILAMDPGIYSSPFIRKYIFPGGYVPRPSEALSAVEGAGLWLLDFEVWRRHYAFTLREWERRFLKNRERARALLDERFCRMWELYLAGFQRSFEMGSLAVMQLQFGRRRDAVPLTRDYLDREVRRLVAQESEAAA